MYFSIMQILFLSEIILYLRRQIHYNENEHHIPYSVERSYCHPGSNCKHLYRLNLRRGGSPAPSMIDDYSPLHLQLFLKEWSMYNME